MMIGGGTVGGLRFAAACSALVLWALLCVPARAADIIGSSDRDPVSLNESFTLSFSASEEPDGEPDFSPLSADFQIVNQGKSTQVQMVNGQMSRRTDWKVTALARRSGTLTVPPIAFGDDMSRPFTLTVLPGKTGHTRSAGDEPLLLEVEAEPKSPYVQAQVLYTIRLLHRIAMRNGQLDDPKLIDAVVQKLGEDRRYQTERNGHLYGVIERRYAIFPQKSGALRIEPINLEAELSAGPGSIFDDFFGRRGRIQRLQSEPVVLQVRPIPASFKGRHWLPAAKLQLEESWSTIPPETRVGEPITRTLSIKAEGVTMGTLPDLAEKAAGLADLQRYPDQPSLSEEHGAGGLNSVRREKTAFIPMKDGDYPIPGIEIAWWNTDTDRMEVARVPERLLKASPAPQPTTVAPEPAPAEPVDQPFRPLPDTGLPSLAPGSAEPSLWFWLTWISVAGWLATVLAWWWRARSDGVLAAAPAVNPRPDLTAALKSLQRAVDDRSPAAARRALLDWGLARWPGRPPGNLEQLALRLGGAARNEIGALNRALYGPMPDDWSGEELARLLTEASREPGSATADAGRRAGLEVLYKC